MTSAWPYNHHTWPRYSANIPSNENEVSRSRLSKVHIVDYAKLSGVIFMKLCRIMDYLLSKEPFFGAARTQNGWRQPLWICSRCINITSLRPCWNSHFSLHNRSVLPGLSLCHTDRGRTNAGSCHSQGAIIPVKAIYIFAYGVPPQNICTQIMWLVITEVRSKSFGLATERLHYNACRMLHRRLWYRALSQRYPCIRHSGIIRLVR